MLSQPASKVVRYEPPDVVVERFHASKATVRGIVGPRGTGKSGSCIMDSLQAAGQQTVGPSGLRRTRFLVLRDTYRQLETTTIPSFQKWLGHATKITGQYPLIGQTRIPMPDGSTIMMETVFLAMDGLNIIDNLQSFEASFAYINEARAIENASVVNMVIASTGRFPSKDEEGCTSSFVVMDTNPCDETHWWYQYHMKKTPANWEFFSQESPLLYLSQDPVYRDDPALYVPNPRATYARIQNKGYNYWLDQIPGAGDPYIRTMIMGKYGTMVLGRPVYSQWWSEECVSRTPLEWSRTLPLVIGIDTSGLHPGAVIGQASGGTLRCLRELRAEATPFDEFVEAILLPTLASEFHNIPVICILDPSNPRSAVGGKTAQQILNGYGIDAILAPTNNLDVRLGSVVKFLQRRKSMIIDPACSMLIDGFRGKYHYKKIEGTGVVEAYKPIPEKNAYADVHDGMQYLAMYYLNGARDQKIIVPKRKILIV